MLPGKKYKPEDILAILRSRFWVLVVPFAVISSVTAAVARKLPDSWRSEAIIQVAPQRVPTDFVKPTVSTTIEERLQAISQQILSRTRLERLIQDFNLYPEERKNGIMEDVVAKMRTRDIEIRIIQGYTFKVSYTGDTPRTTLKVAEQLATFFIEESLRDRTNLAEVSDQFLEAQLDDARRQLVETEKKIESYQKQFSGELPSQLSANLQSQGSINSELTQLRESLNRDAERRVQLERSIAEAEAAAPLPGDLGDPSSPSTMTPSQQQLAQLKANLANLERRYTPGHPEIRQTRRQVEELQKKVEAEALAAPLSTTAVPQAEQARRARLANLKSDLEQLNSQSKFKQQREQTLMGAAGAYQKRIEMAPTRESELIELNRDYGVLQKSYSDLLAKKQEAKIAANLESRQIGEQFKLLDAARLPERPVSPNRPLISVIGMVAGLGIGLGLIGLLEYRDSTFKTDDEVTSLLNLPVLATVPSMTSVRERQRERKRSMVIALALGSTVTVCLAVLVYYTFVNVR